MSYSSVILLIVVCFFGCASEDSHLINRNGTCGRQDDTQSLDWVAQRVESSASFHRIVAHRSSVPRRYQVGSPPAWCPGWFIDFRDEESAQVAVGADMDENFWHRWETLRVWRSGRVERMVICPECQNDQQWIQDE